MTEKATWLANSTPMGRRPAIHDLAACIGKVVDADRRRHDDRRACLSVNGLAAWHNDFAAPRRRPAPGRQQARPTNAPLRPCRASPEPALLCGAK
jgi:hypothetical protein